MGFAERTFIVLDKQMVAGDFVPGEPHVEGQCHFWLLVSFCEMDFFAIEDLWKAVCRSHGFSRGFDFFEGRASIS